MTEPPGARLRVGLSALTVAEYFRDAEGKDVLLFIDNIFRFTQAGSEVSALLGRMPSAVGYQPTLLTEMGELQERITSTKKGSITSVQAIYVPADDYTDPAPATTFAHLDATTNLSRQIAELGIYPAVDPLASTSRILDPRVLGEEHYNVARSVKQILQRYKDLQDIIAILGIDELSEDDKLTVAARAQDPAVPVAAVLRRRAVHRLQGQVRADRRHDPGFKEIVDGKHDDLPEQAFYMVGTIEEAVEKAARDEGGVGASMALPTKLTLEIVTPDRVARHASRWTRCSCPAPRATSACCPGTRRCSRRCRSASCGTASGQEKHLPGDRLRLRRGAAGPRDRPGADRRAGRGHRRRARRSGEEARRGAGRPARRRPTSTSSAPASR